METSESCATFSRGGSDHALIFFQTNILVGADRQVCVAGLGSAYILPTMQTVDIDRSFHGAALELIDRERWGLADASTTMASDAYAFGILTWEVGSKFIIWWTIE